MSGYQDVHHHQGDFFDGAPCRDALWKGCQPPTDTPLQQAPTFLSPGALAALSSDLQCSQKETEFLMFLLACVAVFNLMPENSRVAGPYLLFWTIFAIFHLTQGLRQIRYRNVRPSSSCSQWKKSNSLE